ncbi:hypothetical protein [Paraburkholderia aspalathi]
MSLNICGSAEAGDGVVQAKATHEIPNGAQLTAGFGVDFSSNGSKKYGDA